MGSYCVLLSEKQQLLTCLKDDTIQLIDLRENKTIYSFRFEYDYFIADLVSFQSYLSLVMIIFKCVQIRIKLFCRRMVATLVQALKMDHSSYGIRTMVNVRMFSRRNISTSLNEWTREYLFDLASYGTSRTMVTSVAWQPDGRFIASSEKHRQVILWSDWLGFVFLVIFFFETCYGW
jgi:WD40 repeat protein